MSELFHRFAKKAADAAGSPWAFTISLIVVIVWLLLGPIYRSSDTWQLTINTAASIVPTLMVFLIQNTQNRDARVIHLKLDKLLSDLEGVHSSFINLESLTERDIERVASKLTERAAAPARAEDEIAGRASEPQR